MWGCGCVCVCVSVVFFQAEDGIRDSSVTGVHVCSSDLIFSFLGWPSRGWFPSIDLWVMGPARFRCATLLSLTAVLRLAPGLSLQKYIVEKMPSACAPLCSLTIVK